MTDVRLKEIFTIEPTMDWFIRDIGLLDDREELATAVRVALGTDMLVDATDVLPDPDSVDRRGWWGDMDADSIWGGWNIGCKNWLLSRAKITEAPSAEGSTLERARRYTLNALQPFINKRMATQVEVVATRTELDRIEVHATMYRGPLLEVDLRYQLLWEEKNVDDDLVIPKSVDIKIRIPYVNLNFSSTTPTMVRSMLSANLNLSTTPPIRS